MAFSGRRALYSGHMSPSARASRRMIQVNTRDVHDSDELSHVTYDDISNVPIVSSFTPENVSTESMVSMVSMVSMESMVRMVNKAHAEHDLCRRVNDLENAHTFAYLSHDHSGVCHCVIDILIPDHVLQSPLGMLHLPNIEEIYDMLFEYFDFGGNATRVNLISQRTITQMKMIAPLDEQASTRLQVYETILNCDEIERTISKALRQSGGH